MPQVLALGAAPTSLKQYFTQQQRWSKGNFDVTGHYFKQLFFGPLTLKQKLHYLLSATYYLIGLRDLILMMAPLPYLFLGVSLIKPNNLWFLFLIYAPMMLGNFVLFLKMFRYPVKSLVLDVVSFPTYTAAFFSSLFKHSLGFVVTIKKYKREKPWAVYKPQIVIATALLIGLIFSLSHNQVSGYGAAVNYFWAIFDALFLWFGFYLIVVENLNWGVWQTRAKRQTANSLEPLTVSASVPQPAAQPVAAQPILAESFAAKSVAPEPVAALESILVEPVKIEESAAIHLSVPVEAALEVEESASVPMRKAGATKKRAEDWSPSWEPRAARSALPKPLRWPAEKLRAKRRASREWNNAEWR